MVGDELQMYKDMDVAVKFRYDEVADHCLRIYHTLSNEFFLHSPCVTAATAINTCLNFLNSENLIQFQLVLDLISKLYILRCIILCSQLIMHVLFTEYFRKTPDPKHINTP